MASEIRLPEIGEGTVEGEILKWLVAEGEAVEEDTPLVEVMTDKATVEIPAPFPGTVLELRAKEGEVVNVGAVILLIDNGSDVDGNELGAVPGTDAAVQSHDDIDSVTPIEAPEVGKDPVAAAQAMARAELDAAAGEVTAWEIPPTAAGAAPATPATRRLAREMGINLQGVQGTGRGGRVTKADLLGRTDPSTQSVEEAPVIPGEMGEGHPSTVRTNAALPLVAGHSPGQRSDPPGPLEERIPLRGLRRRIAERLSALRQLCGKRAI